MDIKEKVAYLEGLAEGMNIKDVDNGKFFLAIIDTLKSMADEIDELSENAYDLGEEIDVLSSDLSVVEDFLLDEDYDLDDDFDFDFDEDDEYDDEVCGGCGMTGGHCCDFNNEDLDDDDVEFTFNIECPQCGIEIELDEDAVANEAVTCQSCNNEIELEIEEVDVEDEDAPEDANADESAPQG